MFVGRGRAPHAKSAGYKTAYSAALLGVVSGVWCVARSTRISALIIKSLACFNLGPKRRRGRLRDRERAGAHEASAVS